MKVKLMIVFWFSLITISINLELHGSSIFSQAFCWVMYSGEATQILQTVEFGVFVSFYPQRWL
jgi:hypothetical protein